MTGYICKVAVEQAFLWIFMHNSNLKNVEDIMQFSAFLTVLGLKKKTDLGVIVCTGGLRHGWTNPPPRH